MVVVEMKLVNSASFHHSSINQFIRRLIDSLICCAFIAFSYTHLHYFFVGQIMNRFAKDVGQVDELMAFTFVDFLQVRVMHHTAILYALLVKQGKEVKRCLSVLLWV